MTNAYTTNDIEIHLSDWTDGMDTTDVDVDASLAKARTVVETILREAYPQYSVAVFTERAHGFKDALVRWPTIMESAPDGHEVVAWDAEAFLRDEIESRYQGLWDNTEAWVVENQEAPTVNTQKARFVQAFERIYGKSGGFETRASVRGGVCVRSITYQMPGYVTIQHLNGEDAINDLVGLSEEELVKRGYTRRADHAYYVGPDGREFDRTEDGSYIADDVDADGEFHQIVYTADGQLA